jgi:hypothetical protein
MSLEVEVTLSNSHVITENLKEVSSSIKLVVGWSHRLNLGAKGDKIIREEYLVSKNQGTSCIDE